MGEQDCGGQDVGQCQEVFQQHCGVAGQLPGDERAVHQANEIRKRKSSSRLGDEMQGILEKLTLANANQDQEAMYKLQQTNDKMATLAEQLQDQLKAKDEQISALTAQVSGLNNSIQTLATTIACLPVGNAGGNKGRDKDGGGRGGRGRGKPERNIGGRNIGGYCWSCGFDPMGMNHSSAAGSCFKPKPGHKVEATAANTMGGSQKQASRMKYVDWQRDQYTKRN